MRRELILIIGAALAMPAVLSVLHHATKPLPARTAEPATTHKRSPTPAGPATPSAPSRAAPPTAALGIATQASFGPGSSDSDLVFTQVAPCRIVDTRKAGGRLQPGETRHLNAAAASFIDQGGNDGDCGVLTDAPSVVLNIVAVHASDPGYLTAYAYGASRPYVSSLNYEAGSVIANEVVVNSAAAAAYDFSVYSVHDVDLVIDVAGYFAAPTAIKPECVTTYGDWVNVAAGAQASGTAACPAGNDYAMVSGGCNWDFVNVQLIQYGQIRGYIADQGGFACDADNPTDSQVRFRARTLCCRVPGR